MNDARAYVGASWNDSYFEVLWCQQGRRALGREIARVKNRLLGRLSDMILHSPINAVSEIENESVLIEFRERSPFSLNMMYGTQNSWTTQERMWIRHEMIPILRFCDVNNAGVLLDMRLHVWKTGRLGRLSDMILHSPINAVSVKSKMKAF